MNRLTLAIVAVFLVIGSITLLNMRNEETPAETLAEVTNKEPDYSIQGINSTLFDKRGNIAYQVLADSLSHYNDEQTTLFDSPRYTFYVAKSQPWVVTATEGALIERSLLILTDRVEITTTDEDGFVRKIETSKLHLDIESREVSSDASVTISGPSFFVESNGLKANLKTQEFELKNHVKTHYVTDTKN